MADVFISYKSERRPAARHMAKILGAYGYEVWYDYELIPGHEFEPRLMAELKAAKVVLVLWCTMAVSSEWVLKEAGEGKREDKYLPCWIESCTLPRDFAGADTINLTAWRGAPRSHVLDRLVLDIGRRIGRDPAANIRRLIEIDEDWRDYGAPSLAQFAVDKELEPGAKILPPPQKTAPILGPPPDGITPNLKQHWESAQRGDVAALVSVGHAFSTGTSDLSRDDREAGRLFKFAAERGDAIARFNLGVMYLHGRGGMLKDDRQAARLFELAAGQGEANAQFNLGLMYVHGEVLPNDDHEAVRLFELAANQGNANAQCSLGVMHRSGRGGLPKYDRQAVRLFKLAAEQGNASAQVNLGEMYESGGGGLRKDDREAASLYKLAADQGNDWGLGHLGDMYEYGKGGLAKDIDEAVRLYQLAARGGHEWSQKQLKRLGKTW